MGGYLVTGINFRGWDNLGLPLAGGKLWSYTAGTATLAPTYADESLSVPNSNPVIFDSYGYAQVWIPDASVRKYKFILKDADDVVLATTDGLSFPAITTPVEPTPVPPGGILAFGGAAAPTGYLLCNGAAVSRGTYAALFAEVGELYGAGDGSTTFNVPDLRQRFPLGLAVSGTGNVRGATGGAIDHTHTGPSHTHTVVEHTHTIAHTHTVARDGWGGLATVAGTPAGRLLATDGAVANLTHSQNDVSSGASSAANSGPTTPLPLLTTADGAGATGTANPPYQVVNYIIKT